MYTDMISVYIMTTALVFRVIFATATNQSHKMPHTLKWVFSLPANPGLPLNSLY